MYPASKRDPNLSIAALLSDFRSPISGGALRALEERDDAWRAENRGLREHCRLLEQKIHEILPRSMWLEDKLSEQSTLRQNMAVEFGNKEKWLLEKIQRSEEVLRMVKRDHCIRVSAVASEKASVEEELKKALGLLSKGEQKEKKLEEENLVLVRKIRALKQDKAHLESEVRRFELKMKETGRILAKKIDTEAEKRRSEEERHKLVSDFSGKMEAPEREKGVMEDKICKYEREKNGELETVLNKNVALEAERRRLEEETKKIPKLVHRLDVLVRGMGDMEAECCKIRNENVAVEAERKRLEEENKKILELVQRVRVLGCEKDDIEAEFCMTKKEKISEIERILDDKAALEVRMRREEEEMKEKISELVQRIVVLQREKEDIEADCCKVMTEKSSEVKRILDDRVALEAQMRRKEEEMNEKISEFAQRIVVLQREKEDIEAGCRKIEVEKNGEIERILDDRGALEVKMRNMEEEMEVKISDFVQRIRVLERERIDMGAKLFEAKRERNGQIERFVKIAVDDERERSEREVKERVSELHQKIAVLEKENAELWKTRREQWKMECREKRAMESWMEEKKALEAELSKMKERISKVNRVLEFEKGRVEEEKDNASKLAKRIEILEQEKSGMKAEVSKAKKDTSNLDEWDRKVNMALESQKRRMDEAKEMCFSLGNRILALEKAKGVMEAKVSKLNREKRNEIMRVLKDKSAAVAEKRTMEVEYEKKVSEMVCRIAALESEKVEFEAKICQAEREKSEALRRILNKRKSVEEEKGTGVGVNKKVSELDVLKAEKKALGDDLLRKDEVIKVLVTENELLVAKKTELEREIGVLASTSKEDMESSQQVLHVGTLGAPGQSKGENNTASAHACEQKQISHCGDSGSSYCRTESEIAPANACKRKRSSKSFDTEDTSFVRCKKHVKEINIPASPHLSTSKSTRAMDETFPNSQLRQKMSSEKKKQVQASACTYVSDPDGLLVKRDDIIGPQTWVVEQDLLDALDWDRELCLKAVCALYRQHKSCANSRDTNAKGFKPMYASKAIALAEYLIDEDPEGRMKRSAADLEQLDPLAVDECIKIAKEHYKQVFEVYQKNQDPFLLL